MRGAHRHVAQPSIERIAARFEQSGDPERRRPHAAIAGLRHEHDLLAGTNAEFLGQAVAQDDVAVGAGRQRHTGQEDERSGTESARRPARSR